MTIIRNLLLFNNICDSPLAAYYKIKRNPAGGKDRFVPAGRTGRTERLFSSDALPFRDRKSGERPPRGTDRPAASPEVQKRAGGGGDESARACYQIVNFPFSVAFDPRRHWFSGFFHARNAARNRPSVREAQAFFGDRVLFSEKIIYLCQMFRTVRKSDLVG